MSRVAPFGVVFLHYIMHGIVTEHSVNLKFILNRRKNL